MLLEYCGDVSGYAMRFWPVPVWAVPAAGLAPFPKISAPQTTPRRSQPDDNHTAVSPRDCERAACIHEFSDRRWRMRKPFYSIFDWDADKNSLVANVSITIADIPLVAKTTLHRGFRFGGIDVYEHMGEDLEVEEV